MASTANAKKDGDRFIATLALEAPTEMAMDRLVAKMQELFPLLRGRVSSLGTPSGKLGSSVIRIDDTILTVLPFDVPAPPGSFNIALATEKLWPEAAKELARHKAIVVVSHMGTFSDYAGAMNGALCVTMAVTALTELSPVIGLYWHESGTLCPATKVREQGRGLARAELPTEIWLKMHLFRGEPDPEMGGRPPVGIFVAGLKPFLGRELELVPSYRDLMATTKGAVDLSSYLLKKGPVLKDGDTATIGGTETVQVRYSASQYSRQKPAIRIVPTSSNGAGRG
jgi:hypothetical protein